MQVILTHEQADFDALAAVLGASLVFPGAVPVLPRRMNRNVRNFYNLYSSELPYVDAKELPSDPIDSVILVDTQSLVTLRGIRQNASVQVIDHHIPRTDLPADWVINTHLLGSCTTHFIEILKQNPNGGPQPLYATLLLLGIYEDTGSLTYSSTTPRDIHAAAYLLENGANLTVVSSFLNPPLSDEQRQVYDRLLASAETISIHGQKVVVSCTDASSMTDEVSSIAHKLRDLLDPDGLFVTVLTKEGIRLVARSTNDRINAAGVAAHFGGGGHSRAAAALIAPEKFKGGLESTEALHQVHQELIRIMPEYVLPPVTVGQIMSRRPLLLSPQTPATEAAMLMQKYGYEGYPVVEEGKVIGLLTRRAVDRALAHNLDLPTRSLMEAGEVTAHPAEPLEDLQQTMSSSGWGQVPVIDPQNGQVVGIVTRTDLLKTLSMNGEAHHKRTNLSEKLEAALPPARLGLLKLIAAESYKNHLPAYIVGGFVRDLLLNRPGLDFDIVVEGDAIQLAKQLANLHGGRVVSHRRFGTAKWWIADIHAQLTASLPEFEDAAPGQLPASIDLISARREFYDYPSALPTVEKSSIKLDLQRRDFTINTLALRLDGRHYGALYDYWDGASDLHRGLVRVLHSLSFVDDPTRILRAVRFEQRFNFQIEARTLQLLLEAKALLRQVSGDRLRHELDLMMAEPDPDHIFARLQELELLPSIHPELKWQADIARQFSEVMKTPPDDAWGIEPSMQTRRVLAYTIWLGRMTPDKLRTVVARLRLPHHTILCLAAFRKLWEDLESLESLTPGQVVNRLDMVPAEALYAIQLLDIPAGAKQRIQQYTVEWKHVRPVTDGVRLQELQVPPGPIYKKILAGLRTAWLDGRIHSAVEEDQYLQQMLKQLPE